MGFKTIHAKTIFVSVDKQILTPQYEKNQVIFVLKLKIKRSIESINICYIHKNKTVLGLVWARDAF